MLAGGFDGLHSGHRQLLSYAKGFGLPIGVMTIVGGKDLPLFTFSERECIFRRAGADFAFELPFSEIKNYEPRAFAELLCREFCVTTFVCGEDFRFGRGAAGTPKDLSCDNRVRVEVRKLVTVYGTKVGSNAVKNFLRQGRIETANELLGEPFFLTGTVVEDRKIGRTIGFPTANIEYPQNKFSLKQGVYETRVSVDGTEYKGITNYGARPTFENGRVLTETYLDGFDGNLYGRELTVRFFRYLRDVTKFDDVEALKAQLQKDIGRVRNND